MNILEVSMTIIGAGAYGTALAITLARNGHKVVLWSRNKAHIAELRANRCNMAFLPHVPLPDLIHLEDNLSIALSASRNILLVVPSHAFGKVLFQIKPFLRNNARLAWATKGLETETGRLLQDVAYDILGHNIPLAVISGPTFAKELAVALPTAVSLASNEKTFAEDLQKLLHCNENFRVYKNSDFVGVQLGGAVKNVIAIGAGISDGLGFGANARTALITRGLAEMSCLGKALGAKSATFMGMSGLGDLLLTCTDNQSRNRRFGILLGKGINIHTAKKSIHQVVEGYRNAKEVRNLANRFNVEMPISEEVYQILHCGKNVYEAAHDLLKRKHKDECR